MHQNNLRAVVANQLSSFLAHRVGHNDFGLIAAYRAHKSQANALVTAGGLHDHGILIDQSLFLGIADHIVCGSRFDRAANVQSLEFHKDLRAVAIHHSLQSDNGGVPHRL